MSGNSNSEPSDHNKYIELRHLDTVTGSDSGRSTDQVSGNNNRELSDQSKYIDLRHLDTVLGSDSGRSTVTK